MDLAGSDGEVDALEDLNTLGKLFLDAKEKLLGVVLQEVPGGGYEIRLKLPVPEADMGLITRYL